MRGSASLYLLVALAAYFALAAALVHSAGNWSESTSKQVEQERIQTRLSAACTLLELLSAGESTAAADYPLLQGVHFEGSTVSSGLNEGASNYSRECLVKAGAGKILRVQ